MKKLLPLFGFAIFLTACNTSPKSATADADKAVTEQAATPALDTSGLAQFNNWKAQNELALMQEIEPAAPKATPAVRKSSPVKKTAARKTSTRTSIPKSSTPQSQPSNNESSDQGSGSLEGLENGGTGNGDVATAPAKKEGMSNAVKGAIIGGVGGAAAGAVINKKNRTVGAVVGAVIGAGGGYVIGRKIDQKQNK